MNAHSRQIIILLVLLPVFVMVAPESVEGEDTVYVHNVVQSSSHTGGQGADGVDGVDGQNGADGTSGQDGASVSSGASSAVIQLYNSNSGDVSDSVYKSTTGTGEVYEYFATTATPTEEKELGQMTTEAQQSQLRVLILTLQRLIKHYVNLHF